MANIILLFLCLTLGILAQRIKAFPKNTSIVLNQYVLNFALPAMALYYLPKINISYELLLPASIAWLSLGIAFIFFNILGKIFKWSKKLIGCLILTAGLGNTSFVGIPVIRALFGEKGLDTLIIIDLPGTFIAFATLGILIGSIYSNQKKQSQASIIRKIFSFPAVIAFIIGFSMAILKIDFPDILSENFKQLTATISPIALVSVGYQLKFKTYSKHFKFLALGLFFQLILVPAIVFVLIHNILGQNDLVAKVCIIEAGMAPMITAAIFASANGLKPELSNMMVGYGIPISFVTIGIWYLIIQYTFI